MPLEKQYCVYIMTNTEHAVLYTGYTGNLQRRVQQHKAGRGSRFAKWHHITKLVYYEFSTDRMTAKTREKQIKTGSRQNRMNLINRLNPEWNDLSDQLCA